MDLTDWLASLVMMSKPVKKLDLLLLGLAPDWAKRMGRQTGHLELEQTLATASLMEWMAMRGRVSQPMAKTALGRKLASLTLTVRSVWEQLQVTVT